MLLAIDVGNTQTVFALSHIAVDNAKAYEGIWRFATDAGRTEDEYASTLLFLMHQQGIDPAAIKGAIIASVVPDALFPLRLCCRKYFGCEALVVGKDSVDAGMKVLIDRPEELGADRLVNAVAAWERYKQALIVIDFGTATTFDVVNADGAYMGGAIVPGVQLSLDALRHAAAQLHGVPITRPAQVIGTTTTKAMQSGIYYGYLGLIEGIVRRIKAELGAPDMKVIATGGLASLYAEHTKAIDEADQELTMDGLMLMYKRNQTSL